MAFAGRADLALALVRTVAKAGLADFLPAPYRMARGATLSET